MEKIEIGGKKIGEGEPAFIIAEIGLNHNGDIELAKRMITKAKECNADAVKFQIFIAEELFSSEHEYFEIFKSLQFTNNEWTEIKDFSENEGILFTASVFDMKSADLLENLGSPMFKIASCDITNIPLLDYISKKQRPAMISTGMANISEIEKAIETFYLNGNKKVSLLHCISNYPASIEELNLRAIETLNKTFNVPVGFSDHSLGLIAPAIAVALGASAIEKHFTMDRDMDGLDHKLSLNPENFKEMVDTIRAVEKGLGSGIKKSNEDKETIKKIRRSLAARDTIKKGTVIEDKDLKITRPENGIKPEYLELVLGKKAKKTIKKDEPVTWEDI